MDTTGKAALGIALVMSGAVAAPRAVAAQDATGVAGLAWMAGCWESRRGPTVTEEHWMAPAGGLMLGMSRTVARDTARAYEALRIQQRGGVPVYIATPSGQAETAFTATSVSDTLVVFANPAHDFPQRILYRPVGRDSLVARIEGPRGGQVRGMDIPMRRVRCPGG